MVIAGIDLLLDTPATLLAGPGLEAYARTIADPASPHYLPEVVGTIDPNSFWLTIALAAAPWLPCRSWQHWPGCGSGCGATCERTLSSTWAADPRARVDLTSLHLLWIVAWLPTWALIQNLGSMPFQVGIAVPFGFALGLAAAYTARREDA